MSIDLTAPPLVCPTPAFRLFQPTREKLHTLTLKFLTEKFWISDESRNVEAIQAMLVGLCGGRPNALFYEYQGGAAVVGFSGIVPGWRANVTFKLIDGAAFGPRMVRDCRALFTAMADALGIFRLSTESPDPRIVRMAKMAGFHVEGTKQAAFQWDGEYYDDYMLALMLRGREEGSDVL